MNTSYAPIFELTRGKLPESYHFGAAAVVNARGQLIAWYANPETVTYLRSSAKPFQILPFLEHGGQKAFELSLRELALICASHHGTDEHVEVVRGIQAKTGVVEADLLCGVHSPAHKPTTDAMRQRGEKATPNRNNCSGKHTGMVAHARLHDLPYEDYINPAHPVQQEILAAFAQMCTVQPQDIAIGIDGCSAPNFALSLRSAALGFARLCDPEGQASARAEACQTVVEAMTSNPYMVGGPESFDTDLMQATQGRILSKGGAEGYQAMAVRPGVLGAGSPGLGIAFKVSDGDLAGHSRSSGEPHGTARPAVALEILRQLGAITAAELQALADYGPCFELRNLRRLLIGQARPCFTLQRE